MKKVEKPRLSMLKKLKISVKDITGITALLSSYGVLASAIMEFEKTIEFKQDPEWKGMLRQMKMMNGQLEKMADRIFLSCSKSYWQKAVDMSQNLLESAEKKAIMEGRIK